MPEYIGNIEKKWSEMFGAQVMQIDDAQMMEHPK